MKKPIVVGCDSAATALKQAVTARLQELGHQVEDVVAPSDDAPYPLVAAEVCRRVLAGAPNARGVLLCGTGLGMTISANKFKGIYAALIHDVYSAERAALSNDANVVALGSRVVAPQLALKLLERWLELDYRSGPSDAKLAAVKRLEEENFRPA
ncbi:MAG: RpiB/LacA/LacB family sugar-phosphate isomerase [Deltaproteobacteria bacterium]|jgi:ribose 5-phosphate isomerase B|nr:RpiB/LacA/LacB family sugar-phosphate isomerase [Deltaproteobacteria bacterium]